MVNKKRLITLLESLIKIRSENPPGDEFEIANFIKKYLEKIGVGSKIYEFKKRRSNIIAVLEGKSRKSLLISPHLDTVPAGKSWKVDPFIPSIRYGRLYGLGATDCKVNLACALEVMNSMVEDKVKLGYDLIFAATADEETGSDLGLIPLLDKGILKPDAAVILDSDDFDIVVTQKGLIHLKIRIQGKRAHGAYPWRGVNAIDLAIEIIREIQAVRFKVTKNKYLKPPTINIGTIRGGDKVNIVADWCEFELDFRFLPQENVKELLGNVRAIVKRRAKRSKIEIEGIQDPYSIDETHSLVKHLKKEMRKIGIRPLVKGSEGATVITFFQHKRIPAVATGFGSEGCAHIADEFVKVDNLVKGATVLESFLKDYRFNT